MVDSVKFKLNNGHECIVDKDDYLKYCIENNTLHAMQPKNSKFYVRGREKIKGEWKYYYLHRLIIKAKKGQIVDHINGDTFDNRKDNLRICTAQENSLWRKSQQSKSSKYPGVYFNKVKNLWCAQLNQTPIGYYKTELEAWDIFKKEARNKGIREEFLKPIR